MFTLSKQHAQSHSSLARSSRKPIIEDKHVPSPGTYDINSDIGKGTKVSFGKTKPKPLSTKLELGPGSYELARSTIDKP